MSSPTEVTRREFLKAGATAGAGLAIAFYLPRGMAEGVVSPPAQFAPNAWIAIDSAGIVTFTLDKSEMGQGTHTGLAMVLAEELEADWSRVRLGAVPVQASAWSRRMSTGGSSSIRGSWEIVRKAGATAREMLLNAAARRWRVERATCRAERGAVIHTPTGRRLSYGKLVEIAATLPVPTDPPLKDPKDFRILGTRVRRLDTPPKVTGGAAFGIDVRVPGMLVATVARSPVFGGGVKSFDATAARAVTGVRHVVELKGSTGPSSDNSPRVWTESGVAVVADYYWQAAQGRRALKIVWDDGPNALLDSAGISAKFERLAQQAGAVARTQGSAASALASSARKVDSVYEVPYLHHATMEPMNCTAYVRGDSCDVWAPTQNQSRAQEVAAELSGLPKEACRVHTTLLGGGFGRRLEADFVAEAVRISKAVGAPVKLIWSREDDVQHGFYRPATYNRLAAGLDPAGRPVAWTHRIVAPSILSWKFGRLENGIDRTTIEGAANLPYAIPNIQVEQLVADIPVPLGFWRSVGSSHNAFVTECFFDEVAAAAGKDACELRRELLRDHPRHLSVLNLAAEKAGWGTPLPAGRHRGIAVAESFGSFVAQVAEVSVAGHGGVRVHRVVCAVDCGPVVSPDAIEAQMEGGIVFGLTAALYGAITIEKGRVVQSNFHDYPMLRMNEMPVVETYIVPSTEKQGGIGEPGVPPIAPAVCNAIFAATGKRVRKLPISTEELRRT